MLVSVSASALPPPPVLPIEERVRVVRDRYGYLIEYPDPSARYEPISDRDMKRLIRKADEEYKRSSRS